ncbi:lipoprotein insertase outer membrane protein LolB [Simiduia sp. 21SJ11W-1]|uniref:lipoprotein insertase outer membrane protein LolB n=1 Tax=Simiduia sp. 21SJ11W-1 TaxID=2909669 RepID=UPI00209CC2ED|nr:lipoprotein insertase outer membrane protein LolB [Simiduia sp. 21SJ11W-1]UTA47472.1 lipoprotein insertase outer membrane protein LolB [Simiduia sp. 21SJ11W-1]
MTACTRLQPLPAGWVLDEREQALLAIDQWRFDGKLGVRAPGDSGSAYVNWDQAPGQYSIRMQGPLGQGSAKINGSAQGVKLTQGDQVRYARNATELVQKAFGWQLPMAALEYWVRGLPAPGSARAQIARNEQGLLVGQSQDGWELEYSQYKLVQGHALPGRLKAESKALGVRLILVINDWQLGAES